MTSGGHAALLEVGASLPLGLVSPLDLAIMTAPTVQDALETLSAGWWLVAGTHEHFRVRRRGEHATVDIVYDEHEGIDCLSDVFALAAVVSLLRTHSVPDLRVDALDLAMSVPTEEKAVYNAFFGAVVTFDAARTQMLLAGASLALPLRTADPEVHALLRRRLGPGRDAFIAEFRAELRSQLRHNPSLGDVSKRLGVSPRAAQRALAQAGLSYRAVRDEVRLNRAKTRDFHHGLLRPALLS